MFEKGEPVRCIIIDDETADGKHQSSLALLNKDRVYHVEEYNSSEECAKLFPDQEFWQENGGRMILSEFPKSPFFGKRFKEVDYFGKYPADIADDLPDDLG